MKELLPLTLLLTACAGAHAEPQVPASSRIAVGPGFYSTWLTPAEKPPSTATGGVAHPKVATGFAQLPTTNEWWSSLIWQWHDGKPSSPYSENMFPHPLTLRARATGLELGYPTQPTIEPRHYDFPHRPDLLVGVAGLAAPDTRVESYSDWVVTAGWSDASHHLSATFGHGLPFVYAQAIKGEARVESLRGEPKVLHEGDNVVALAFGDRNYALFAPRGSSWKRAGNSWTSSLNGRDFYSVAALPDSTPETLALFTEHAFAFVTGSTASYHYDRERAEVATTFQVTTVAKETSASTAPLLALYRHQWLHSSASFLPQTYVSPRGTMKLVAATAFETRHPITGMLPALPLAPGIDRGRLAGLLRIALDGDLFKPGLEGSRDSYWEGKSFGKLLDLAQIADQLGERELLDQILTGMKRELEDWFDGQSPRYYYYDETWRTLIGVPTMYYSSQQLNDHHFHYGYYIHAAATIAQFDRAWAQKYAPCIELLIRDAGNYDRSEQRFPYFRYFDLYAGHSWASGTSFFPTGNNQESSSEDLNFAAAVALWGAVMGNDAERDAGLFLHAVGSSAIGEYWYNATGGTFPAGFSQPMVSLVWGDGGWYDTWFNYLPGFVQGIQLTPLSTGSLWLGRYPRVLDRTLAHLTAQNGGENVVWRDLFWMLEALSQPEHAAQRFEAEHYYEPEFGNSLAHTYQWLESLRALGRFAPGVTAATPFHAAFERAGKTTHVAFSASPSSVTFSDGATLRVSGLTSDLR
ncbi:MAG TPA: glycosyl hydrolase [Polyangiaceae bacterium]|nr:glycosyl hydrolase [Polyangiaceae bacterium]